jgi:hypothetical protein
LAPRATLRFAHPRETSESMPIEWKYLVAGTEGNLDWAHSGIAVTDGGDVIFAEPSGGGLVLFRRVGDAIEHHPVPLLEIHGISYTNDSDGEVLWLADPGFKARFALDYDADIRPGQAGSLDLSTFEFEALIPPPHTPSRNGREPWQPTAVVKVARAAGADHLVAVADGYGSSLVHLYSNRTILWSTDGRETGLPFSCPHGLVVDYRDDEVTLVVADRGNRRLVIYALDGTLRRVISDPLFTSPSGLAVRGDDILVTELDGALLAVDRSDSVRSLISTRTGRGRTGWPNTEIDGHLSRPRLDPGELNSPHGIAVSTDGRIYLTEWVIGGRQLELTLHPDHA